MGGCFPCLRSPKGGEEKDEKKKEFPKEVLAIMRIKDVYGVMRNWMGDPCLPIRLIWKGLMCNYDMSLLAPRITSIAGMDRVTRLAGQNVVVIFSLSSCCMCHTIKRLFYELGVNPAVHELDQVARGREMKKALVNALGRRPAVPAIFIGGRLVGSAEQVMSLHLSGQLVPLLKREGALWL